MWLHPDCNAHTSPASPRRQQRLALVLGQAARPRQRRAGQLAVQLLTSRVEFPDAATAMVVVRTGLIEREFGGRPWHGFRQRSEGIAMKRTEDDFCERAS